MMKKIAWIILGIFSLLLTLAMAGCSTTLTGKAPGVTSSNQPFPAPNDKTGLTGSPGDPALSQMVDPTQKPPVHSLEDTARSQNPSGYHPSKPPAMPRKGGGLD